MAVKGMPLIRAVAKVCLDSKDRTKAIDTTIDNFALQIVDHLVIVAYTKKYEEVSDILTQIQARGTGEALFYPVEEPEEIPF